MHQMLLAMKMPIDLITIGLHFLGILICLTIPNVKFSFVDLAAIAALIFLMILFLCRILTNYKIFYNFMFCSISTLSVFVFFAIFTY